MELRLGTGLQGFTKWFFGAVAAVLTAGLIGSLLVMLYAFLLGIARRLLH